MDGIDDFDEERDDPIDHVLLDHQDEEEREAEQHREES